MNYYNDNDPKSVAWLRELIKQNVIPAGDVDERSIKDVTKSDLEGYTQRHFFAGIGGWSEALRLAGWSTNTPVWTGSCPCQPFSSAGKKQGEKDPRHLWPEFYRLIRERKPDIVFGEQVEKAIGMGWLDGVFTDLEAEDYTCGAAVLGAHSIGAPHIRQRLCWVADSKRQQFKRGLYGRCQEYRENKGGAASKFARHSEAGRLDEPNDNDNKSTQRRSSGTQEIAKIINGENIIKPWQSWGTSNYVLCNDGKVRRIEPGICPLADGIPERVGLLRGYGNAIVPQVAAEFIKAYMEIKQYPITSSTV